MNTNPEAKTVLCYGDSNAYGTRADNWKRHRANKRWTGLLQNNLGEGYYVIEAGLAGRTTNLPNQDAVVLDGKAFLETCLDSHAPLDVVILMLGTNDLKVKFDRSVQEIAEALHELVEIVQRKTEKDSGTPAAVILTSPVALDGTAQNFYELNAGSFDQSSVLKSGQLGIEVEQVAKETGCLFVDAALVAVAGKDGIHLSEKSHIALSVSMAKAVRQAATLQI